MGEILGPPPQSGSGKRQTTWCEEPFVKVSDVAQDNGINDGLSEIAYAVDDSGRYVKARSLGWEPKNVANAQAWEVIRAGIVAEIELINTGKRSPLAYHMAHHLMDVGLLASYVRMSRWRVRRHLKPQVFNRLKPKIMKRYADLFGLSVDELGKIPDLNNL